MTERDKTVERQAEKAALHAEITLSLDQIDSILGSISSQAEDHLCPNNSPFGHHDVEAVGGRPTLCYKFKLGCPHPLTEDVAGQLPTEVLQTCAASLNILGVATDAQMSDWIARLNRTSRDLWTGDVTRSQMMNVFARTHRFSATGRTLKEELPEFSAQMDERFSNLQQSSIQERLCVIIEMRAAILAAKAKSCVAA